MRHPREALTLAPADSAKPDEEAIDDVYTQVDATGSIEAAARKLQLFAKLQQQQQQHSQSSSPTEAGPSGMSASARQRQMAMWEDDPEEQAYLQHKHPSPMQVDDEELEDEAEEREVVHLQEVVEGLWIGDLVGAMDTDGLEERGIVSRLRIPSTMLMPSRTFCLYCVHRSPTTPSLPISLSRLTTRQKPISSRTSHRVSPGSMKPSPAVLPRETFQQTLKVGRHLAAQSVLSASYRQT